VGVDCFEINEQIVKNTLKELVSFENQLKLILIFIFQRSQRVTMPHAIVLDVVGFLLSAAEPAPSCFTQYRTTRSLREGRRWNMSLTHTHSVRESIFMCVCVSPRFLYAGALQSTTYLRCTAACSMIWNQMLIQSLQRRYVVEAAVRGHQG